MGSGKSKNKRANAGTQGYAAYQAQQVPPQAAYSQTSPRYPAQDYSQNPYSQSQGYATQQPTYASSGQQTDSYRRPYPNEMMQRQRQDHYQPTEEQMQQISGTLRHSGLPVTYIPPMAPQDPTVAYYGSVVYPPVVRPPHVVTLPPITAQRIVMPGSTIMGPRRTRVFSSTTTVGRPVELF